MQLPGFPKLNSIDLTGATPNPNPAIIQANTFCHNGDNITFVCHAFINGSLDSFSIGGHQVPLRVNDQNLKLNSSAVSVSVECTKIDDNKLRIVPKFISDSKETEYGLTASLLCGDGNDFPIVDELDFAQDMEVKFEGTGVATQSQLDANP